MYYICLNVVQIISQDFSYTYWYIQFICENNWILDNLETTSEATQSFCAQE